MPNNRIKDLLVFMINKFITTSLFSVVLFFLMIVPRAALSEDISAEVININLEQNIVFIDVGKENVTAGDVFSVDNNSKKVYLEVIGAEQGVSKLSLCRNSDFQTDPTDFNNIAIGSRAVRVLAVSPKNSPPAQVHNSSTGIQTVSVTPLDGMPVIDPQMLIKPDITHETIQNLDSRLDKMVESNLKLFNSLTGVLNEKKQWQGSLDAVRAELQAVQGKLVELDAHNSSLKKKLDEETLKLANAVAEREKFKKMSEDGQVKLNALKERLDNLTKLVNVNLK